MSCTATGSNPCIGLTKEALEQLLSRLDADPEQAGVAYLTLRQQLSNFLRLRGHLAPEDAADEVLDRVAAILATNHLQVQSVTKFCYGIARNVEKEQIRQQTRLDKAWRDPTFFFYRRKPQPDLNADFRRQCFAQLSAEDQQFLRGYHAESDPEALARHRLALAAELQVTLNQLRLRVHRLRGKLAECFQRKRQALSPQK